MLPVQQHVTVDLQSPALQACCHHGCQVFVICSKGQLYLLALMAASERPGGVNASARVWLCFRDCNKCNRARFCILDANFRHNNVQVCVDQICRFLGINCLTIKHYQADSDKKGNQPTPTHTPGGTKMQLRSHDHQT